MAIAVDAQLEAKLGEMARLLDRPVQAVVNEAIEQYLEHLQTQKLAAEADAYARMFPRLQTTCFGQFVAVHNGEVIDQDSEFESLFLRVQQELPNIPVLIRQVGESPTEQWRFRNPRLEPT